MSQKKRGLGRGLGALIPSAPESERPVDVFFPAGDKERGATATAVATDREDVASEAGDADGRSKGRSASWDSAIAGGRLSIRTKGGEPSRGVAPSGGSSVLTADGVVGETAISSPGEDELRGSDIQSLGVVSDIPVAGSASEDAATAVPTEPSLPAAELGERPLPEGASDAQNDADERPGPTGVDTEGKSHDVDDVSRETELVPVPGAHFAEIPVEAIRPNSWQPRTVFDDGELDELIDSIAQIGVLQPIVLRPDRDVSDQYELIMGERRWRASQAAGLETIPAIVRETEDSDMLRDALLENLHRAALNPLEEAAAYRQLLDDFDCTHEELASRIARSRPQISNTLRLLKLPPLVQRRVAAGVLSAGHARALLGLTDGAAIEQLAQRIVSEGLSVRATEEVVTVMMTGDGEKAARRAPRAGQRSEAMDELATRLSDRFETRVKVNIGKSKGRLTVEFASVEDLNRILEVMAPQDPGLLRT